MHARMGRMGGAAGATTARASEARSATCGAARAQHALRGRFLLRSGLLGECGRWNGRGMHGPAAWDE